jgi:hypothetical protein
VKTTPRPQRVRILLLFVSVFGRKEWARHTRLLRCIARTSALVHLHCSYVNTAGAVASKYCLSALRSRLASHFATQRAGRGCVGFSARQPSIGSRNPATHRPLRLQGARFPSSKLKLDELFINWLSVPESQKLVRQQKSRSSRRPTLFAVLSLRPGSLAARGCKGRAPDLRPGPAQISAVAQRSVASGCREPCGERACKRCRSCSLLAPDARSAAAALSPEGRRAQSAPAAGDWQPADVAPQSRVRCASRPLRRRRRRPPRRHTAVLLPRRGSGTRLCARVRVALPPLTRGAGSAEEPRAHRCHGEQDHSPVRHRARQRHDA